jgi:hypothetical protein
MPSPWEDFQSSCKLLVIGICHLPSSPNLDSVLADFIDAARSYPSTPTSPSPSELILAVQPLPTDVVVASRARVSQAQPIHFTHRRENGVDFCSGRATPHFPHRHAAMRYSHGRTRKLHMRTVIRR